MARRRLLAVLASRWDRRLVTIEAGAGFGKTTLVAQALAENALDPRGRDVWITAEPADSSASNLLAAILTALGRFDANELPTVDAVHAAVWAAAPGQICLCIDDAHVLASGSGGRAALEELVDALPDNGHLLVASRPGGLPPSARLIAHGRAAGLAEHDLRFDEDELAAVATKHGIDAGELAAAGGWPALTVLWATSGRSHAERFVSEEVLRGLDAADRRAFVRAVAVGGGDVEVIEAAAGGPVDMDALSNLPLVVGEGGAIRPHALWEQLLARELESDDIADARRRAASVMRARGDTTTAFELLAGADDWDEALPALFEACNDQRRPPWRDVMERWRLLVPASLAGHPQIAYLDALIEREVDPWSDRCVERFDAAMAGFDAVGDLAREITVGVRAGFSHWLRGDIGRLEQMRTLINQSSKQGVHMRALAMLNDAVRADIAGDNDAMVGVQDLEASDEPRLRHFPPLFRTFAKLWAGDSDAAIDDAETAANLAAVVWPAAGTGWAVTLPALTAWSAGAASDTRLNDLTDPGPRLGVGERSLPLALSAIVKAQREDERGAEHDLARLRQLGPPGRRPGLVAALLAVASATLAACRGDDDGARKAFADELGDLPLDRVGAGRVMTWFPGVSWLYFARARPLLEDSDSSTARAAVIEACRALELARAGDVFSSVALLDRPEALATALPTPAGLELTVHALAAGDPRARSVAERLIGGSPEPSRRMLRKLAPPRGTPRWLRWLPRC